VAAVNARLAIASPGDLRLAVNAIMTLDAFFGILHAALFKLGSVKEQADDKWKEELARADKTYRLLRDSAYALKHGELDSRKPRLVRRHDQILTMPGSFDQAAFDRSAFDTETVWMETEATDFRADETIKHVLEFAHETLKMLD
jgi:hypothetical protein